MYCQEDVDNFAQRAMQESAEVLHDMALSEPEANVTMDGIREYAVNHATEMLEEFRQELIMKIMQGKFSQQVTVKVRLING